jgi:diguanylate cyclase (GGDEF)-like protein
LEEDITPDLTVLQGCLDRMISRVEQRDLALQQFNTFQTKLFALNSLPEMIDYVLNAAVDFFGLKDVSLSLVDKNAKIAGYLSDSAYDYQQNQNLILLEDDSFITPELKNLPYIGGYGNPKHGIFFPATDKEPVSVLIIPLTRHGQYLGSLNLGSDETNSSLNKTRLDYIQQMGFSISICLENQLNFEVMRQAALNETLVTANNRRFLEQRLTEELERGQRSTNSLTCLLFDVDFPPLKEGQEKVALEQKVLNTAAETIKRQLRVGDVFSYYEGKKFAAFLPNVPEAVILKISERIKTAIEEQVIHFSEQIIPLSLILGSASHQLKSSPIATKTHQQIALELIAAADSSLYQAKRNTASRAKKRVLS